MGISLTLEKSPERHHKIRIIHAAILVVHSIFEQRNYVGIDRPDQLLVYLEAKTPGLGQSQPVLRRSQITQDTDSAYLSQDITIQSACCIRHEIRFGSLAESRVALLHILACRQLDIERNRREH